MSDYEADIQSLVTTGQLPEAVSLAKKHAIHAMQMGALISQRFGSFTEAANLAKICVNLEPNNATLYGNLSFFLADQLKCEEALEAIDKAISLSPKIEFYYNKAVLLSGLRRIDEAIECYRDLLLKDPQNSLSSVWNFNLGCMLMLQGNYKEGLAKLEYRFQYDGDLTKFLTRFNKPCWDGKTNLKNKRLLLFSEQGCGDVINYIRYVPELKDTFLIIECQEELTTLIEDFFDVTIGRSPDYKLDGPPELPEYDYIASVSSLPHLMDPELKNIPPTPYLSAKPFNFNHNKLNVGIVWAGSITHNNDISRSCPPKHFLPLNKLPNVQLYSLQKGPLKRHWCDLGEGVDELKATSVPLDDFATTARFIKGLDLVITVDTAVGHLAGALGVPVLVLLAFCHDHRWLLGKNTTHWYSSMKLFRQKTVGNWDEVVARVVDYIQENYV